ncbi:synaptosome-associated proteinsynaptosomal-associated protein 25 [Lyophyllum atratum]|nr:synaptosome-associated proteinsynaptosomal-associated protein 25 [Lyophyllum atratum]
MPLFKRKEQNLIPPVSQDNSRSGGSSPSRSPYHSNASTYIASRDGDPYNTPSSRSPSYASDEPSVRDKYSRSNAVGDIYSRGGAELDKDRNELFAGYNAQKSGSGRFFDGPQPGREPNPGEENEEDVEGIKQQTRFVKQDSVNSTRNALRLAREAEDTARNTLTRLGDQSEKLANTERHLDVAKGHSSRAEDNTNELKQLNRSIFRPVITFNKDAKRAAQEAKIQARYDEERDAREKTMVDIRETQNRLGRAQTYGRGDDEEELIGSGARSRFKTAEQEATRKEQRKRYQFDSTASDDELEDELDNNLDEIGDVSKRLKALGMAMGQELDNQNVRIDQIEGKAGNVERKIHLNTQRVRRPYSSSSMTYIYPHSSRKSSSLSLCGHWSYDFWILFCNGRRHELIYVIAYLLPKPRGHEQIM